VRIEERAVADVDLKVAVEAEGLARNLSSKRAPAG
jgi:hypothetical protein